MNNASLEHIKNFSTNREVINKINEIISKYIELIKSQNPDAEVETIKNNVDSFINGYLMLFEQGHFSDDLIITQLQTTIETLNRRLDNRGGKGLKRRNKKSRKSNKKSRKSNKKSRKSK